MRSTVVAVVRHLCPFVEERDEGEVIIAFDGAAPEMHALSERIRKFENIKISHEDLTDALSKELGAKVVSRWRTAGMTLIVECG